MKSYHRKGEKSTADSTAKKAWDKANTFFIGLKLNRHTDAMIIDRLETVNNRQGYIKEAIREKIERERQAKPTE